MSFIEVKNLSIFYGDHCALKECYFEAKEGEFIAIVGKSGSGKTSFLNALADFVPFSGEIIMPKKIGVIFQKDAVFPWLTVEENIAFGLEAYKKTEQNKIVQEHIKLSGLEDKKDKYPAELSGGQIQRVALARSLAPNPEVLLMDEPYGALDAYTKNQMQQWLLNIWAKHKKTIIFITHDIEEALFLSDRVLVLNNKHFLKEFISPFLRPRNESIKFSAEFNSLKKEIYQSLHDIS